MIDVYIYEGDEARREDEEAELWEDVPCAPQVGDTVFLRRELGRKETRPEYRVISVEWFNSRETGTRLHAYVVVQATLHKGNEP